MADFSANSSDEGSIDTIALLRIPGWNPDDDDNNNEDLDVRELDDGAFLVYLDVPFDSEPEDILETLFLAVGEAIEEHDDPHGVFILPDVLDPEDATSYEAVVEALGDAGDWLVFQEDSDDEDSDDEDSDDEDSDDEDETDSPYGRHDESLAPLSHQRSRNAQDVPSELDFNQLMSGGVQNFMNQAFASFGMGGIDDVQKALREADPDQLQMMQIQMQSALEKLMTPPELRADDSAKEPEENRSTFTMKDLKKGH